MNNPTPTTDLIHHTPPCAARSVARCDFPQTPLELRECIRQRLPVVLRANELTERCRQRWTPEELNARIGCRPVRVSLGNDGLFLEFDASGNPIEQRTMLWTDAVASLEAGSDVAKLYLHKLNVRDLPELWEDIVIPPPLVGSPRLEVNMWVGSVGATTQLHHDLADNLLAPIRGRRRVRLIAPDAGRVLGRFPLHAIGGAPRWHLSTLGSLRYLDLRAMVDLEIFDVTVEPGEMLFIPLFWWHEVEALDSFTLSLTYWWSELTAEKTYRIVDTLTLIGDLMNTLPEEWTHQVRTMILQA